MLFLHKHSLAYAQREQFYTLAFRVLVFNGIDGDYAEFGCGWKTFTMAYHAAKKHRHKAKFWGFDSFEGLPPQQGEADEHPRWEEGGMLKSLDQFRRQCRDNGVPEDSYVTVKGFYNHTLEKMSPSAEPTNIALAYIDCDLYSSTVSVLKFLEPRLKHGMIIALDDYYCFSSTKVAGNRKAIHEFFHNNEDWSLLQYLPIGWNGMSFIVEKKSLLTETVNKTKSE